MARLLVVAAFCFLVAGCGRDKGGIRAKVGGLPRVVSATFDELKKEQVLPGSYIVAFRNHMPEGGLHYVNFRAESQAHHLYLQDEVLPAAGVKDITYLTALDLAKTAPPEWQANLGEPLRLQWNEQDLEVKPASIAQVDFSDEETAQKTLKKWEADGRIWYAEPNYMSKLFEGEESFEDFAATYAEIAGEGGTRAPWFEQISLVEAYQALHAEGVSIYQSPLIAVMDSGIDYKHPDLEPNMWENPAINQAGCANDVYGCNTTKSKKGVLGDGDAFPVGTSGPGESCAGKTSTCKHGTHVAGIIAAKPSLNNFYGGVCPVCQVMSVRIVGKTERGEGSDDSIIDSSIIAGLAYISRFKRAGDTAIRVVNASFGKFQRSRTVELLVRLLGATGKGILVIAAAGNEDTMLRQYPAAFSDVIAVANVESNSGIKNSTSNFGRWVNVSAPGGGPCDAGIGEGGQGIRSTLPGNTLGCSQGSSMSAPMVAGIAGLLLVQNPELSLSQLRSRIVDTAEPEIYEIPENKPYYPDIRQEQFPIPLLGVGVVNARNAIRNERPEGQPVAARLNRVTDACGFVGRALPAPAASWLLFLAPLALSFGFGLLYKRK